MADQISVTDLAEHLGVSRMTLIRLLTGKIRMSASMALKLSDAFPYTTHTDGWICRSGTN